MSFEDTGIPPAGSGGVGPASPRPSRTEQAPALVDKPRRQSRPAFDPFDLEAAFARLAELLSFDSDKPRQDVPRGFYLNILV